MKTITIILQVEPREYKILNWNIMNLFWSEGLNSRNRFCTRAGNIYYRKTSSGFGKKKYLKDGHRIRA